jgi:hypothetical protein
LTRGAQDDLLSAVPLAQRLSRIASNAVQYEPLRMRARQGGVLVLEARGFMTERFGRERPLRNIYGVSMQKAGSQWAKALFEHELVVEATGLATFPQAVFDGRGFRNRFPAHCFAHLYLSYPEYTAIHKRAPYRTFYIARDPRDIVVSWYFSVRDTHRVFGPIAELRDRLTSLPFSEGLLFSMRELAPLLNGMRTWVDVAEPEVAFFRLEDIRDRPEPEVRRLLSHCRVELGGQALARVVQETSRDALRSKDLARRATGEESHYRREPSAHEKRFDDVHHETFRQLTGDLIERLGYA